MIRILLGGMLLFSSVSSLGVNPRSGERVQLRVERLYDEAREQRLTNLYVVGGWAIANIGTSLAVLPGLKEEARCVARTSLIWNLVSLGIVGAGWLAETYSPKPRVLRLSDVTSELYFSRTFHLAMAVLDLGYIGAGLFLVNLGNRAFNAKERWELKGYGKGVLIQGAALLAMDLLFMIIEHDRVLTLESQLGKVRIQPHGMGLRVVF